jgi:AraC-like DNA-binding protein
VPAGKQDSGWGDGELNPKRSVGDDWFCEVVADSSSQRNAGHSIFLSMVSAPHLVLHEIHLNPGQEWAFAVDGWRFFSVVSGQGYWLSDPVRSLDTGEAFMISPITKGVLRASQLAGLSGVYFQFHPDRLTDLLTPVERHFLEAKQTLERLALRHFPANDPVALEFASLAARSSPDASLASRSSVLRLIAMAVGIGPGALVSDSERRSSAAERFQALLGRITEAEFIRCSVESLALQCRCSTRHLSRLFRTPFSLSFSARQTELRMQKAAQMLRETDLRIAQIASECGYRHIGLFNATFKRRWKRTPSEWRQASRNADSSEVA